MPATVLYAIAAIATAGVIVRPFRWPEWIWATGGAALAVAIGSIPPGSAAGAIADGADVCLFLAGMMLLSETARAHGLFDRVAAAAVAHARGSRARLFLLVYGAGVAVTMFLSNDATAVVLTPAVLAAARRAEADPLPPLLACALVANAASFVLPISNPANLVLAGGRPPALGAWLAAFAAPSVAAILATYAALRWCERDRLRGGCAVAAGRVPLSRGGIGALFGIVATAALLLVASARGAGLGTPTAIAGLATAIGVSAVARASSLALARGVAWGVLPLVLGLFVLVAGLERAGLVAALADMLGAAARRPDAAAAGGGAIVAVAANLANNLPVGLVAGRAIAAAHPPQTIADALLIGVDLGPNLSVTGSLATILWLQAIRREGEEVSFGRFLRVGLVAMPPALAAAIAARLLIG